MFHKMDYKYFNKAKQVANVSDFKRVHIGCIAVYQGNIIGLGCNTNKTHPRQDYYNRFREIKNDGKIYYAPKLHAEINCINSIRHLDINFSKVKLYVYRKRLDSQYGIARPCPSCMSAIKDLGIKHIYFTTNDGYAYQKIESKKRGVA